MGKRYSPSSSLTYSRCPRKWLIERTLRQAWIGKPQISSWIGSGVAAGMELYHTHELTQQVRSPGFYADYARDETFRLKREDIEAGAMVTLGLEPEFDLAEERAAQAVRYLVGQQPLRPDFVTKAAELCLPDWGNARIDLLVDSLDGLMVIDYKTTVTCTRYMLEKKQRSYEWSLQLYFYAMALRTQGYQVDAVAIAHLTIEPKPRLDLFPFMLEEHLMEEYSRSLQELWPRMEETERTGVATMALVHEDQYGLCEWSQRCLVGYEGDTLARRRL